MFVRPTNPISHRLARIAFILATVGSLIVAVSGPLHRYLGLDIEAAIAVFRYGFYLTVAGVALGLATILPARPGDRRRGSVAAFLAIVIGGAGAWVPLHWFLQAQHRPAINDITTDTATPPPLVATVQLRRGAPNPLAYPKENAALQRAAFPDIEPVMLAVPPAVAKAIAPVARDVIDAPREASRPAREHYRTPKVAHDPFFDRPYEPAQGDATALKTTAEPLRKSSNIKSKRKVAALFKSEA